MYQSLWKTIVFSFYHGFPTESPWISSTKSYGFPMGFHPKRLGRAPSGWTPPPAPRSAACAPPRRCCAPQRKLVVSLYHIYIYIYVYISTYMICVRYVPVFVLLLLHIIYIYVYIYIFIYLYACVFVCMDVWMSWFSPGCRRILPAVLGPGEDALQGALGLLDGHQGRPVPLGLRNVRWKAMFVEGGSTKFRWFIDGL